MNYDSESSDATILSSNDNEESAADNCEIAKILDLKIQLPQDLCENREIFQELFSLSTWNSLTPNEKEHLSNFLPQFPEHNEQERNNTINQLFSNKITRFGISPLNQFHNNLQDGNYRPDIAQYRKQIMKAEAREQRIRMCERISLLAEKLVLSREKLLRSIYSSCPEQVLNTQSISKQLSTVVAMRGNKRYAQEIALIKATDDDDKSNLKLSKRQIKLLDEMDKTNFESEFKINSTISNKERRIDQILDTNISNEKFNYMLASYKKRKEIEPEHSEMEIDKLNLKEVLDRSSLMSNTKKLSQSLNNSLQFKKSLIGPSKNINPSLNNTKTFASKKQKIEFQEKFSDSDEDLLKAKGNTSHSSVIRKDLKSIPSKVIHQKPTHDGRKRVIEDPNSIYTESKKIVIDAAGKLKVLAAKGGKISQMDKKKILYSQSPDDSNESAESSPELKYETQNCFLSLLRDIFCSTCDHRMKLEELRRRIHVWLKNPVAPMNSWFKEIDHWENLLTSAVLFLSGEFQYQPEDFVPYLEFKSNLNIYQWIGAGRDSDARMLNLYKYWLSRHNEMGIRASNTIKNRSLSKSLIKDEQIIPIRNKSEWKVRPGTDVEIIEYHNQERQRYENPNIPFTYRQHGYESVVGPIKQSPFISNTRNDILMSDRPKHITTSNLVLDAVARLPNGEGTCSEICELLKYSQYLAVNLNENVLQSAVNTILETLSAEALNPSVRFDSRRKVWIYLHRNFSEDDFKEMQLKQRKKIYRKIDTVDSTGMRLVTNRPPISFAKTNKPNIIINVPSVDSKATLKMLPKQYVTKPINSATEPFDAEASLDVHTMPIVKVPENKTQRVTIKVPNQNSPPLKLSPPKNNSNIKGNIIINKTNSPKITTIGPKKVNDRPIMVSKNKVPPLITKSMKSISTSSNDGQNQNYLIALNVNSQQIEPPALCATSPSSTSIQQKNIIKINPSVEKNILNTPQTPKFILTTSSLQKTGKLLTIPRNPTTPMLSQQKQILTNVIVEQQKAKSEQNQIILAPSTSNQTASKLIQIQQPSGSLNISSPQQQVFHLKQLKQDGSQQTMILKPQIIKTVSTSSNEAPTLVSVNKIIKSSASQVTKTSLNTTTVTSQRQMNETTSNPIVARVISSSPRQIVDGTSLQKGATTFKVANANTLQHGIIQIAGNSNCSVISKGKNIVSVTPTQAKTTAGLIASSTKSLPNTTVNSSASENQSTSSPQQPLKIVQNSPITTQQLLNAKLINVQAKNIKNTGGIKMINSQGYITNIGSKAGIPIILAAGKGNLNTSNDDQRIVLQADTSQTSGFVINPNQSALKLQDNVLTQQQTVVIGNQVLKLNLQGQKLTKSATGPLVLSSNSNTEASKVELSGNAVANQNKKIIASPATSATTTGNNQQIIFGSNIKVLKNMIKTSPQQTPATTTRLVLAPSTTQSGQQIAILPANFGIKTLQGIKVIQQGRIVPNEKKSTTSNSPASKETN
ncbi:hypothetical protein PVAND_011486 [Polypedilum vanderplanki]|uniref:DEUBAD domain-containing protein n=1 Tax=Polypedilum vanderplanki TaxID=319348 RepID=A0A9J6CK89_POLVA|nr:hypothetical protein PVAND_011486 [Polypedilum vanderplanki]